LCGSCLDARQAEVRRVHSRSLAEAEAAWNAWEGQVVNILAGVSNGIERAARVAVSLDEDKLNSSDTNVTDILGPELLGLLPGRWRGMLLAAELPNDNLVQRWFLRAVKTSPPMQDFFIQGVFKRKSYSLPGWNLANGARSNERPYTGRLILLDDGRRFSPRYHPDGLCECDTTTPPPKFSILGLRAMAQWMDLPALPIHPMVRRPQIA
jgi:hypothetical protein